MSVLTVLGGGFAGVWAAMSAAAERKALGANEVGIALLSKDPCLTVRPRLYEGAKPELRVPLAPLMAAIGVDFRVHEVTGLDLAERMVHLGSEADLAFARLVLATGSRLRRPPIPGAKQHALSVDTFEDAQRLDRRLESISERATVVVIGASFTGIELATELRGRLGPDARILLIDPATIAGAELGANPQPVIAEALAECRIETRLGRQAVEVGHRDVLLDDGERIAAQAVVLTTGIEASPLTRCFPGERDKHGRLKVQRDLRVTGNGFVFAAGDTAHALADDEHSVYMSCQHAIQLGRFAGHNALRDLLGLSTRAYRQDFYATCLDLGPSGAVFTTGWDRQVQKVRDEGKAMKRKINCEWIYPPSPALGDDAIFERIALPKEEGHA